MFKVILKQPWAEMASAGLMTEEHIDVTHEEDALALLFHASK